MWCQTNIMSHLKRNICCKEEYCRQSRATTRRPCFEIHRRCQNRAKIHGRQPNWIKAQQLPHFEIHAGRQCLMNLNNEKFQSLVKFYSWLMMPAKSNKSLHLEIQLGCQSSVK